MIPDFHGFIEKHKNNSVIPVNLPSKQSVKQSIRQKFQPNFFQQPQSELQYQYAQPQIPLFGNKNPFEFKMSNNNLEELERLRKGKVEITLMKPEIIPKEQPVLINKSPFKVSPLKKSIKDLIKKKSVKNEIERGKRFKSYNPEIEEKKGIDFNKLANEKSILKNKIDLNELNK